MTTYCITFRSVTLAQRGERVLAAAGQHCSLARTPRWMEERGCGYCLRLRGEWRAAAAALDRAGIEYRKIYRQTGEHAEEVGP